MADKFDFIILGAGPNGLAIGAYLSKAGQKVLLLEKRLEEGGGLMTEQVTLPEFYHNTHALYMMMADMAPVYEDFEFETKWDVHHVFPDLQVALPTRDGRCLCFYRDVDKTCQSIAQFSDKDAKAYRTMHGRYDEMMRKILGPQTYVPMDPAPLMAHKAQLTELGRELSELAEMTPQEIVCGMYENELVRTALLYMGTHWGLDYAQSGVSYMVPIYLNRMVNYQHHPRRIASRLQRAVQIDLRPSGPDPPKRADQADSRRARRGQRACCWKTAGSTWPRRPWSAPLNPHQTFLDYVGRENLEQDFVDMIENYMWEKWSLNNLHLALERGPPFQSGGPQPGYRQSPVLHSRLRRHEGVDRLLRRHHGGDLPEQFGLTCTFPSVHDSYQAPAGKATAYISQMAPYDLRDGGKEKWYKRDFRAARAEQMIELVSRYTTNTDKSRILKTYMTTPVDIENKYATMVKGGYKHGAYHPLQMGYLRPNQDCSQYRTPIKNLYVGGASVAPGGMIIWGPGYNCANAVAEDYGIEKWWQQPEMVRSAIEQGYV